MSCLATLISSPPKQMIPTRSFFSIGCLRTRPVLCRGRLPYSVYTGQRLPCPTRLTFPYCRVLRGWVHRCEHRAPDAWRGWRGEVEVVCCIMNFKSSSRKHNEGVVALTFHTHVTMLWCRGRPSSTVLEEGVVQACELCRPVPEESHDRNGGTLGL